MTTVPTFRPVTTPAVETVAIEELDVVHVTAVYVAPNGNSVAFTVIVLPTLTVVVPLTETPVTGTTTVTRTVAVFLPSREVATI